MFPINTPTGDSIKIPETPAEDVPYFAISDVQRAVDYYHAQGYVVIRGCVPGAACDAARRAFIDQVRPYEGYLYRQVTGNPEVNRFNDRAFVMNPLLNIQDVPTGRLGHFRTSALSVICSANAKTFLQGLFGEAPKVVQTMYFEGNAQTWPHQDTYYLDSERIGTMAAAWYAVEDIKPGAGRFFIYPGSHLIDLTKNGGDFDIAFNHARYKQLILDIISKHDLPCRAPALMKGDALFWNAKTIHGSLETRQPQFSRSSLTAHFIPESHRFLQFQSRNKALRLSDFHGWQVNHPKSLDRFRSKAIMGVETRFPRAFQALKRSAVKLLVTR